MTAIPVLLTALLLASPGFTVAAHSSDESTQTASPVANAAIESSPVTLSRLDFTDLPRLVPLRSGVSAAEWTQILKEHEVTLVPLLPEEGETRAGHYKRTVPFNSLVVNVGHSPSLSSDLPGAVSVYAQRRVYLPGRDFPVGDEIVWRWEVPAALREGWLTQSRDKVPVPGRERYHPVVLTDKENREFAHLYLFDSAKGLLWERDLRKLRLIFGENRSGQAVPYTGVKDINVSVDGTRILVLLVGSGDPEQTGTRLLLFDGSGKLLSATEFVGTGLSGLRRSESGTSFVAHFSVDFSDGKPITDELVTGDILLDHSGTVVGVLSDEKGKTLSDAYHLSGDDKLVIGAKGTIFQRP